MLLLDYSDGLFVASLKLAPGPLTARLCPRSMNRNVGLKTKVAQMLGYGITGSGRN